MFQFIVRRILIALVTIFAISIMSFVIIQLPPGDFLTSYVASLASQGDSVSEQVVQAMRENYGLDQPIYVQYLKWIGGVVQGDFGRSLEWGVPVADLIWDRLAMSLMVGLSSVLFVWSLAIPIGVYSATNQYSLIDYISTFLGFLGLAIPNFMLALVLMWIAFSAFGQDVGGLFSPEFQDAPWSFEKFINLLSHLWIPMIVVGTAGTAGLIRTMRANMLDEINQPYVETARAKGLSERRNIWKYPVRVALNPFISTVGYALPSLIGGEIIVAVVLNLPTIGPILLRGLLSQDMFLAGAIVLLLSVLTVLGTLLSDILLALLDPRIRME
ncbi:MAG: ABC transporter permease [Anaerolineae bacterium]|nr:ABC transporter permease [Anaerolineae bacterium]MCA9893022.1 ABC transporter permease [Anaerolineae bacterium]MCB9458507.1 ABC transporter permease [Anaerolineaceae bacterium]